MGVTALLTAVVLFLFGIIDATALFAQLVNSNTLLVAAMIAGAVYVGACCYADLRG